MKFENINVYNFKNSLRGMRNPKESYSKIDSIFGYCKKEDYHDIVIEWYKNTYNTIPMDIDYHSINEICEYSILNEDKKSGIIEYALIGPNDMKLAKSLIQGGSEHRKFLRQIFVSVDITAPLYFFKEFDTYKVSVTANSTSTMHTIHKKPITRSCFETDDYHPELTLIDSNSKIDIRTDLFINNLEQIRQLYLQYIKEAEKDKKYAPIAKQYWKELIRWLPESWLQTRTVTMNYENLLSMYHQRKNHKQSEWSVHFINFIKSLPYAADFIIQEDKI